ncbi:MAG: hypothetical protein H6591_02240 [Flavobacteriales bacterium]|nr:hypothetical protein [Flavobacteriales bacterium]
MCRSLLAFIVVSCSCLVKAQAPFIEIAVTDTIYLEATSIVYRIDSGKEVSFMGVKLPVDTEDENHPPSMDLEMVQVLLQKNDFRAVQKASGEELTPNSWLPLAGKKQAGEALLVTLHSREELARLQKLLKGIEGYQGSVHEVFYAQPDPQYPSFHARVIGRARAEAEAIAKASDLQLGNIIAISERPSIAGDSYTELMQQMFKKGFDMFNQTKELRKTLVRTMLIRFEANH